MKPYYLTIKDPKKFLKYYFDIYTGDYNKARTHKIFSRERALWFRKINRRISELAYYALYTLNQKLEQKNMHLNYFGWGIICLCQKKKW